MSDVDYRVPTASEITQWVNGACSPSVVGIEAGFVNVNDKEIYVVEVPPTFELHELRRELNAKSGHSKHTVFMRQNEHTESASVRDAIAIRELKILHRQEILNPSSTVLGGVLGAIFAALFWSFGINAGEQDAMTLKFAPFLILLIGGVLGSQFGWAVREFNSIRYDWPYYEKRQKIMAL